MLGFLTDSLVFIKDESDNELLYSIGHDLHNVPDQHPNIPVASVQKNIKVYILCLSDIVLDLYTESKCFLFSTNTDQSYNGFSDSVKEHLKILNYKDTISVHVHALPQRKLIFQSALLMIIF